MANLTEKQKLFCKEYLVDLNATQAAIRAGYKSANAYQIGAENLRKPQIQAYLQEKQQERSRRTDITADFVLKQLAAIASTKITDVVNVQNRSIEMEDGTTINVPYVVVKNTEELTEEQKVAIASIKQTKNGVEIKMHDKVGTLKLIGDHLGMFNPDKSSFDEAGNDGFIEALKGEAAEVWEE